MIAADMDVQKLEGIRLFYGLPKQELESLARTLDEVDVPEGFVLAREGRFAYEFFIIERGTAEVTRDGNRIAELGPGDFFGEIGLVETERRTASVLASTPMLLAVMHQRDFKRMEHDLPTVADRIESAVRARLAE
jgi:CRP/FNR family transcriptional regulator, cyclic AMP receptor protein